MDILGWHRTCSLSRYFDTTTMVARDEIVFAGMVQSDDMRKGIMLKQACFDPGLLEHIHVDCNIAPKEAVGVPLERS